MNEKVPNPQLQFLAEMDEDRDLDDELLTELNGNNEPTGEEEAVSNSDSEAAEADKLDSAELDAVTGAVGTLDADAAPVVDPNAAPAVVPEPAPVVAEAPAPAPAVVEQPQAVQQPAPVEAPAQPSDADITKVWNDWRGETETLLAQHHYRLTEEEMALMDTSPQEVIPKMMSKVYLDAVSASLTQFLTYLPRMVRQVNEQDKVNQEAEDSFFGRWEQLKPHKEAVMKIGQVYRQMNPAASAEQFINEVGAAAMVSLRLDPTGSKPAATPAAPAAFVPAAQTPQGGVAAPKKPINPYTALNEEFDRWDEELE